MLAQLRDVKLLKVYGILNHQVIDHGKGRDWWYV